MPDDAASPTPEPSTAPRRVADAVGLYLRGFAMGAADIVPGVSGGTIALVTGVYERFIDALQSLSPAFLAPLARGRLREASAELRRMRWSVLIPIGLGVVTAVLTMSTLLSDLMETSPGATYAFFFGLIAASAWIPFSQMRSRSWRHAAALLIAGVGAWALVGVQPHGPRLQPASQVQTAAAPATLLYPGKVRTEQDARAVRDAADALPPGAVSRIALYDPHGVLEDDDAGNALVLRESQEVVALVEGDAPVILLREVRAPLPMLFLYGMIAISAMMLPGVSGAFLMLFLGQYHTLLSSIARLVGAGGELLGQAPDPIDRLTGQSVWDAALLLGVFNLGVLLGLGTFSRLIGALLARAHDLTMAALTGLMLGALRQPMREMLADAQRGGGADWSAMGLAALAGGVVVTALTLTDRAMRSRREG